MVTLFETPIKAKDYELVNSEISVIMKEEEETLVVAKVERFQGDKIPEGLLANLDPDAFVIDVQYCTRNDEVYVDRVRDLNDYL